MAASRPNLPIEDILHGKAELQRQRMQQREQRLQQRDNALRGVSKINPKSAQIVQTRYILQGETTRDRLNKGIGNVKKKTIDEIEKPTFRPSLNPNSLEIANAATGVNFHYSAEERNAYDYSPEQASFERFHGMAAHEFDGSSSDGPLLYEDIVQTNNNRYHSGGSSSSAQDAMYLKSRKWNEARQQRIEKERKERERQEKQICTFKPKIDA